MTIARKNTKLAQTISVSGNAVGDTLFIPSSGLVNVSGILTVNNVIVSMSGHSHTSSDISDFNSSVSGILPVKDIVSGSGISIASTSGIYTITVDNSNLVANTGNFDVISFNLNNESILTKGQISWDDTEGTMDIGLTDNTTIHIGEHRYFRIRNNTGDTLYKGQPVYATGVHNNGIITPSKYVADGTIREVRFMGLILENVLDNNNGYVVDFGHLEELDLDGSASNYAVGDETWNNGDILYVHPTVAGKLTKVEPKHSISVAIILDVGNGNGNGRMFVRPISYGHLSDNHDVAVSGATNGQFLQYNSITDYWVPSSSGNFTSLSVNNSGVSLSGHTHTNSDITNWNEAVDDRVNDLLVGTSGINISYNDNANTLTIAYTGVSGGGGGVTISNYGDNRLLTSDGTTTGINAESNVVINSSGNVGIGTTSPQQRFVVSNSGAEGMEIIPALNSNESRIQTYNRSTSAWNKFSINCSTFELFTNGGTTTIFGNTSGNVGIGTTSPQARLHVSSTNDGVQGIFTGAQTANTQSILFRSAYHTNNGTAGFANIGWIDNASQGGHLTFGTTSDSSGTTGIPTERMRITSSGNVGIGSTSPTHRLEVVKSSPSSLGAIARFYHGPSSDRSFEIGVHETTPFPVYIQARNTGTTTNTISIQPYGGSVGIGTNNPSNKLDVRGGEIYKTTTDFVFGTTGSLLSIYNGASTGNTYSAIGALSAGGSAWNNLVLQVGGNVGIGTTNPSYKLDVFNSNIRSGYANNSALLVTASSTASTGASIAIQQLTGEGWTAIFADYEPYVEWGLYHDNPNNRFDFTAGDSTNSLRSYSVTNRSGGTVTAYAKVSILQSSGDLLVGGSVGIGTSSPASKLHITGGLRFGDWSTIHFTDGNGRTSWYGNATTNTYLQSEAASRITQSVGEISFHTAAAGTAGGAITWGERFRLDNTGSAWIKTTRAWNDAVPALNIGNDADARLQVRHVWGKNASSTAAEHLFLQFGNGANHVQIGNAGQGSNLYVGGDIAVGTYFSTGTAGITASNGYVYAKRYTNIDAVSTDTSFGLFFNGATDTGYAIYREAGAWTNPFPDLRIGFHTGIKLGANATYNGIRFYTDYDMSSQVMSVNNSADPLGGGNVYVNLSLQAGSSLRAPIFYDSQDTNFYCDPNGTSRFAALVITGSDLYVGDGVTSSIIRMRDSDEGERQLHCNSNRIGFLNQSGGWGSWCEDDGSWATDFAMYAPIYYDRNNTGYYLDPNGTSNLYTVVANNTVFSYNWFRSYNATGWYNETYGGGIWMSDATWVRVYNNKQFFADNIIQSAASVRAPIFYDSVDTNFYCDPNGSSALLNVGITGTLTNDSLFASAAFRTATVSTSLTVAGSTVLTNANFASNAPVSSRNFRAWGYYNGSSATPFAALDGLNVGTTSRSATGTYTVSLAVTLSNSDYAVFCSSGVGSIVVTSRSTTTVGIITQTVGGTPQNTFFTIGIVDTI
jgi:hypothetical protein